MTSGGRTENDYYHILGVLQTATPAEITSAYHDLAWKFHPDVGAADPDSLARLKLVNQAYEVLSDQAKRRAYDRQRRTNPHVASPVVSSGFGTPRDSGSKTPTPENSMGRNDIMVELPIAPEEAFCGGPCDFALIIPRPCGWCDGYPRIAGRLCEVCEGEGTIRERRRLEITLPRRVQPGTIIRIAGQGRRWENATGDLLLRIRIQPCW